MKQTKRILVIEDDKSLLQAITTRLEKQHITYQSTRSGTEALEMIHATSQDLPAAVWLDFDILDMNGLEFMKEFNKQPAWKDIPVIIVSNTGDPEKIDQALKLGAKQYIVKAEAKLDDIINQVLEYIN